MESLKRINTLKKVSKIVLLPFTAILFVLTSVLNMLFVGNVYRWESVDRTVGLETFQRSQGVTTDGKSWIFSGKTGLVRIAFDNETVLAINEEAIPEEFSENYGSAHIGGISYANGYIYAPIEDSKKWEYPIVALFDGETLEYTGRHVILDNSLMTRGVPWVTCDTENGLFYVAECRHSTELLCYDIETFEYKGTIPLEKEVDKIQGAEMYKGKLYAATNDATRAVYEIDIKTGEVKKFFDRIMYQPKLIDNFGGEGEGITVLPMEDGTVFHALDIGALFIDSNLRHYKEKPYTE
ncbi:MAG: hypothetical protein IJB86_03715 [Clostridia bacterium]|nr:hypothetical protein [Clostridia bacterium]